MGFIKNNHFGVTLIELLIAISIIAIMTSVFVLRISLNDNELLRQTTEQTLADFKQIRNLAASRVLNEDNQYPIGGYGIFFQDKIVNDPAYYVLFADNGHFGYQDYSCQVAPASCPAICDGYCDANLDTFVPDVLVKKYIYDEDFTVYMQGAPTVDYFHYTFQTAHSATTTYQYSQDSFVLKIANQAGGISTIQIPDDGVDDEYIFGSINVVY